MRSSYDASVKISGQSVTNSWCKVSRKRKKKERRNRRTNPNTNPLWGRGLKIIKVFSFLLTILGFPGASRSVLSHFFVCFYRHFAGYPGQPVPSRAKFFITIINPSQLLAIPYNPVEGPGSVLYLIVVQWGLIIGGASIEVFSSFSVAMSCISAIRLSIFFVLGSFPFT